MTGNYKREVKHYIFRAESFNEDDIVHILMNLEQIFDEKNRLILERRYDNEGNLEAITSYQYDESGNIIEQSEIDASGEFAQKLTFLYDTTGKLVEKDIYYVDESFDREIYHYNSDNQLVEIELINSEGEREQLVERKYDHEKLLEEIYYDESGNPIGNKRWQYDEKGLEVKFENKTDEIYTLTESIYDDGGHLSKRNVYGINGDLLEIWEKIEANDPFREEYWEANRFGRSRYVIIYDEQNREISRKSFNENGDLLFEVERYYRSDGLIDRQRIIIHGTASQPSQFEEYRSNYQELDNISSLD